MPLLLQTAKIKDFSQGDAIVLIVEISLVGMQEYIVNKVYTLPKHEKDNIYYYIESSEDFIFTDKLQQEYIRVSEKELEKCYKIQKQYICNLKHPTAMIN